MGSPISISAGSNGVIDFKDDDTTYLRFSEVSNNAFVDLPKPYYLL